MFTLRVIVISDTALTFQWFVPLIDFPTVLFAAYLVGLVVLIFLFNLVYSSLSRPYSYFDTSYIDMNLQIGGYGSFSVIVCSSNAKDVGDPTLCKLGNREAESPDPMSSNQVGNIYD